MAARWSVSSSKRETLSPKAETILELENEKAVAPIPSTAAGVVAQIRVKEGDRVAVARFVSPSPKQVELCQLLRPPLRSRPKWQQRLLPWSVLLSKPNRKRTSPRRSKLQQMMWSRVVPARRVAGDSPHCARARHRPASRSRQRRNGGRIVMSDSRLHPAPGQIGGRFRSRRALQQWPRLRLLPAPASRLISPSGARFPRSRRRHCWRKTISRRMVENWNTIPHVTQFDDVDIAGPHGAAQEVRSRVRRRVRGSR